MRYAVGNEQNAPNSRGHCQRWVKSLRQRVEKVYGNGFVTDLALEWNKHLEAGLLGLWRLDAVEAIRELQPGIIRFGGSALQTYEWDPCGTPPPRS